MCDHCRATSYLSHPITGCTLTRMTGAGQSPFCSLAVTVRHVPRERWLEVFWILLIRSRYRSAHWDLWNRTIVRTQGIIVSTACLHYTQDLNNLAYSIVTNECHPCTWLTQWLYPCTWLCTWKYFVLPFPKDAILTIYNQVVLNVEWGWQLYCLFHRSISHLYPFSAIWLYIFGLW